MPLTTGTCLGPYEIQSQLGAGGMGEVYRANDTRLDRTVAIKVLPAHVADDPDIRQRFEREAKTISSLNHPHPHICTLYDIGSQDGIDSWSWSSGMVCCLHGGKAPQVQRAARLRLAELVDPAAQLSRIPISL